MKFKQFKEWCSKRCEDGCWGFNEALTCIEMRRQIGDMPFWKREKTWKEIGIPTVEQNVVKPTVKIIAKEHGINYLTDYEKELIK